MAICSKGNYTCAFSVRFHFHMLEHATSLLVANENTSHVMPCHAKVIRVAMPSVLCCVMRVLLWSSVVRYVVPCCATAVLCQCHVNLMPSIPCMPTQANVKANRAAVPCQAKPHRAIPCHVMPCRCHAMPCRAVWHAMSCYMTC